MPAHPGGTSPTTTEPRATMSNSANPRKQTRTETKKNGINVTIPLEKDDVHNATDGRRFLEKKMLLWPAGQPPTTTSLSYCLHQVAAIAGIRRDIANAVRAAAYLVEEMEDNAVNEVVRDAVISQTNELAEDIKSLVEDAKEKIGTHIQERLNELTPFSAPDRPHTLHDAPKRPSYANVLIDPPSHADPKLAAREGIRARQIMLEGIDPTSKVGLMNGMEMKEEFNKILNENGLEGKGIRSVTLQKNKGVLIEMENDHSLNWLKQKENSFAFRIEIGPDVLVRPRPHTVIAFNVPLTFDPENLSHRDEVCDTNNIEREQVYKIRWVKPRSLRPLEQKTAHLFLTFTDASTANRAISAGLTICGRRTRVEKVKKEPTRCLKCQGWNHQAHECPATSDKCANCAEDHRTAQCPHPQHLRCVSCDSQNHASWSRSCPTYLRKVSECDSRNPENALHFFPTMEPWTWTNSKKTKNQGSRQWSEPHTSQERGEADTYRPDYRRGNPHPSKRGDSYRPNQKTDMHCPTDSYRPVHWGVAGPIVDWNNPPLGWDNNLPPSRSWDDETPLDTDRMFQEKTTNTKTTTAPDARAAANPTFSN